MLNAKKENDNLENEKNTDNYKNCFHASVWW